MISLDFDVDKLIHDAMSSGDKQSLKVYRLMKAEFLKKQTEVNRKTRSLSTDEQLQVILKMASEREDSIKQYKSANRFDLVDEEEKELVILKTFLPKMPSDEELVDIIQNEIALYKNESLKGQSLTMAHMKPMMNILKKKYPTISGKLVSNLLKDAIG